MNIINVLQLLTEGKNPISDIREKTKGKVPESVLDTLASLMKDDYYDKTAMAIIKTIQNCKEKGFDEGQRRENLEFIIKRPKLVYAALKENAKGNSEYNPERDLDLYFYQHGKPLRLWSDYRRDEKNYKEFKKNHKEPVLGLKGEKPIETKDAYLFIPRAFKFENGMFGGGLRISDLNKQWENLKSLSMSIAAKDTSGEVRPNGDKATDNHWCVASDNNRWYKNYKSGNLKGVFVLVVNKNKDGSPNWNDRYLYWDRGYGDAEVADKFNRHEERFINISDDTLNFIRDKIENRAKTPKADEQYDMLKDRVADADHKESYTKKGTPVVNTSSPTFKNYIKILRFLRNSYQQEDGHNENEDPKILIWRAIRRQVTSGFIHNRWPAIRTKYYVVTAEPGLRFNGDKDTTIVKVWKTDDETEAAHRWGDWDFRLQISNDDARKIKANINELEPIIKKEGSNVWQRYQWLKPDFKSKSNILLNTEAPKGVKDALKNNKYAIDMWEAKKIKDNIDSDELREFYVGPYFMVSVGRGQNTLWASYKPWDDNDQFIVGDLSDPDIVEKVKKIYEKILEKNK